MRREEGGVRREERGVRNDLGRELSAQFSILSPLSSLLSPHTSLLSPHTHYIEIFHIPFIALQILLVFNNMVLNKKEGSGVRLPGFKFCLYKLCNYVNLSKLLNLLKPLFGNPQMRITIQSTSKGDVKIK